MRPFENVRILDLTHVLAGPFCTYQLALLGAEVIKIEAPGNPDCGRGRGAAPDLNAQGLGLNFQVQGANKRALALDIATPDGKALFLQLVRTADVVVQNYRVGALDALGLGAETLLAINPRLIHCSITGFGQTGPWAGDNAYDNVVQAVSGIMAASGGAGAPVKTAASIIDYATGMNAAFAVSSALYQRTATGRGQIIDCAMLDTALMFQAPEIAGARYGGRREPMPKEAGLGVYQTRDGLLMVGAFNVRQNARLWTLLENEAFAAIDSWEGLWAASPAMRAALTEILAAHTADHWEEVLNGVGVPARRVRSMQEAADLDQVQARGYLQQVAPSDGGAPAVTTPITPFQFAHDGARIDRAAPTLGQDTDAILADLGLSPAQIGSLKQKGVVA